MYSGNHTKGNIYGECKFSEYGVNTKTSSYKSRCVQEYQALQTFNTMFYDEQGNEMNYESYPVPSGCRCEVYRD